MSRLSAEEILAGKKSNDVIAKEIAHGNSDLIRVLKLAGVAGPFKVVDPWRLRDENGLEKINAGGYSALPFGDRYPELTDFAERFMGKGDSTSLPQQAASPWRAELATRLVEKLSEFEPDHADSQVFFSNSGTEAVESAIKFAAHYRPKAKYFINFERAYHGKTMGALSLTPNANYQKQLRHMPLDVITLPFGDLERFEDEVRQIKAKNIASIILEPIQGEAGVIVPSQEFLEKVNSICKQHGILVIADEIQTGLGRSGYWFASVQWGKMTPDIITLAKPLGGGLTAVGATIARRKIYSKMLGGMDSKKQSNTFGGNALSMAIGLKSMDILEDENLVERAQKMGQHGKKRLQKLVDDYPGLFQEARGFGMLYGVTLQPFSPVHRPKAIAAITDEAAGLLGLMMWHQAGVLANFSLNSMRSIRLTPALTMPEPLFDEMFDKLEEAAKENETTMRLVYRTPKSKLLQLTKFALIG